MCWKRIPMQVLRIFSEAKESRMFRDFPADVLKELASKPLTANSHKWSLATSVRRFPLVSHSAESGKRKESQRWHFAVLSGLRVKRGAEEVLQSPLHQLGRDSGVCLDNRRWIGREEAPTACSRFLTGFCPLTLGSPRLPHLWDAVAPGEKRLWVHQGLHSTLVAGRQDQLLHGWVLREGR